MTLDAFDPRALEFLLRKLGARVVMERLLRELEPPARDWHITQMAKGAKDAFDTAALLDVAVSAGVPQGYAEALIDGASPLT